MSVRQLLIILLSTILYPLAVSAYTGIPPVINYTRDSYNGDAHNWNASIDNNGIVYVANTDGLLSFDGSKWHLYSAYKGYSIKAVLAYGNRIYTGGFESFGYWSKSDDGRLSYTSLSSVIKTSDLKNEEVWNIVELEGRIYFQTFSSYIVYDGKNVTRKSLEFMPLAFIRINDRIFAPIHKKGLAEFDNGKFTSIVDFSHFSGQDVTSCAESGNGTILIGAGADGLWEYDGKKLKRWKTKHSALLKNAFINRIEITADSSVIVATRHNGILAFDLAGNLLYHVNKENGLQNNTVLGIAKDNNENIWAMLDNGISIVRHGSPFRFIPGTKSDIGTVYDLKTDLPYIYFGTNQGLYRYSVETGNLKKESVVLGQVTGLSKVNSSIICGYNDGTAEIRDGRISKISGENGGTSLCEYIRNGERIFLQGTYTGITVYQRHNTQWRSRHIAGFNQPIDRIMADHQGNIWASHARKGLFKLSLDNNLGKIADIRQYDLCNGKVEISIWNGRVIFLCDNGIFTYDDLNDKIAPYTLLEKKTGYNGIRRVIKSGGNRYWLVTDQEFILTEENSKMTTALAHIPFSVFGGKLVNGQESVFPTGNKDIFLFNLENGACIYRYKTPSKATARLFFNEIKYISGSDTIYADLSSEKSIELPYGNNNSITFNVAFPENGQTGAYLRYRLEGLTGKWEKASGKFTFEYSRLDYGKYKFIAEVMENSNSIARLERAFTIRPPFYASWWAFAIYSIASAAIIIHTRHRIRRTIQRNREEAEKSKQAGIRAALERQRLAEAESERLRLRSELLEKSKEAAGASVVISSKETILQQIKNELAKQKEKLGSHYPDKYYNRLMKIINDNMGENGWELLKNNFDNLHNGFFRNLKERHPELTTNDLRLCSYIRLNLSTKDISRLSGISEKSVEMARYRLRKKMGLDNTSLTEYIMKI